MIRWLLTVATPENWVGLAIMAEFGERSARDTMAVAQLTLDAIEHDDTHDAVCVICEIPLWRYQVRGVAVAGPASGEGQMHGMPLCQDCADLEWSEQSPRLIAALHRRFKVSIEPVFIHPPGNA